MILNHFKVLFPVCCKAERTKPQEVNTGSIQCSKHLNMDTSTAWNGIYWGQLLPSFARGLGRHFFSVLQLLKQFSDVQPDPNLLPAPTSQGSYSAWRKSGFDRFLHLKKKTKHPNPEANNTFQQSIFACFFLITCRVLVPAPHTSHPL